MGEPIDTPQTAADAPAIDTSSFTEADRIDQNFKPGTEHPDGPKAEDVLGDTGPAPAVDEKAWPEQNKAPQAYLVTDPVEPAEQPIDPAAEAARLAKCRSYTHHTEA